MKKNKGGRPSKLEKINMAEVERLAGLGLTDEEMATMLGIAVSTLNNYKKNREFMEALKRGKTKVDAVVVNRLLQKALDGDTTAMIFWLKNRQRERWRDRSEVGIGGVQGGGSGVNEVKIEVVHTREVGEGEDGT